MHLYEHVFRDESLRNMIQNIFVSASLICEYCIKYNYVCVNVTWIYFSRIGRMMLIDRKLICDASRKNSSLKYFTRSILKFNYNLLFFLVINTRRDGFFFYFSRKKTINLLLVKFRHLFPSLSSRAGDSKMRSNLQSLMNSVL